MATTRHRGVKVLKLADGRHVARWTDPVTRKPKQASFEPLGITNAKARERWCIEKLAAIQAVKRGLSISHGTSLPVRVSIEDSQARYMETFSVVNTVEAKRPALANAKALLRNQGVSDVMHISGPHLAAYADHVRRPANPHRTSTSNLHLAQVGAWLRWCSERGMLPLLSEDQIKRLLKKAKGEHSQISLLQPKPLRQLLTSCLAHDREEAVKIGPFVLLTLLTGCRFAEVAGLRWAEVDSAANLIQLPGARVKTGHGREIDLSMTPSAGRLLDALSLNGGRGKVFPHLTRSAAESARARLSSYDAPSFTWHELRRTCGSLLVCGGVMGSAGPFLTAKRLGHSVAIAEKHYQGAIRGLPKDCSSLEQAAGIEDLANAIVQAVAVVGTNNKRAAQ